MDRTKKKAVMGRPREKAPANPFDVAVGTRIKALCQKASISAAALGKKLGKSEGQVFRYWNGDTAIGAELLAQIAAVLGCKASDLVDGIKV